MNRETKELWKLTAEEQRSVAHDITMFCGEEHESFEDDVALACNPPWYFWWD